MNTWKDDIFGILVCKEIRRWSFI